MKKIRLTAAIMSVVMMLSALTCAFQLNTYAETSATEEASESSDISWAIPSIANTSGSYSTIMSPTDAANWWGTAHLGMTDISGVGVEFNFISNTISPRQGVYHPFALDGLSLRFDSLTRSSEEGGCFAVLLSSLAATDGSTNQGTNYLDPGQVARFAGSSAAIVFDTKNGRIVYANSAITENKWTDNGTVLLSSELIKYAEISGKEFILFFEKGADNKYYAGVTVEGRTVVGTEALPTDSIYDTENVYAALGNWFGSMGTRLRFTGVGTLRSHVIETKAVSLDGLLNPNGLRAHWSNTNLFVQQLSPAGGIKFIWTDAFRNVAQGSSTAVKLDGMYMLLSDINRLDNISPKLGIFFNNVKSATNYSGMLSFVIDTENGQLIVNRDPNYTGADASLFDVIAASELLKYESIKHKDIIIKTDKNADGGYTVKITVGGAEAVNAIISSEIIAKSTAFDPEADAYVSLNPACPESGTNTDSRPSFSVEFVEVANTYPTENAVAAIAAIGSVSLDGGRGALVAAREAYDSVFSVDKAKVTNYAELVAKEEEYKALAAEADKDMIKMSVSKGYFSNRNNYYIYKTFHQDWAKLIQVKDSSYGGMNLSFVNAPAKAGVGESYMSLVKLDGLKLRFDGFDFENPAAAQMAVVIGNRTSEYTPSFDSGALAIAVEPDTGTVRAYSGKNDAGTVVINADSALKGDNIKNRRFSYTFAMGSDGSCELTVDIGGYQVVGTIPKEVFDSAKGLTMKDNCTVCITNAAASTFSIDFTALSYGTIGGRAPNTVMDETNVRTVGVAELDDGKVNLQQAASGIEFKLSSSDPESFVEVYAQFSVPANDPAFSGISNYIDIYVNDVLYKEAIALNSGALSQISIYREKLAEGETVKIKILKRSEAIYGSVIIDGLNISNGIQQAPPADKDIRILAIGDSITAGQEIDTPDKTLGSPATSHNPAKTYAYRLADMLDADIDVMAYSGYLVSDVKDVSVPKCYDAVKLNGNYDYIVVNLGTNDFITEVADDVVAAAVKSFTLKLKSDYPEADIIWAYGLMTKENSNAIKSGIAGFGSNVYFCELPTASREKGETGLGGHPLAEKHEQAGTLLFREILFIEGKAEEGDLDKDGVAFNAGDLVTLRSYLIGSDTSLDEYETIGSLIADFNHSGNVDISDLVRLKKMAAN